MFVVCCFLYFIINNKDFVRAVKIYLWWKLYLANSRTYSTHELTHTTPAVSRTRARIAGRGGGFGWCGKLAARTRLRLEQHPTPSQSASWRRRRAHCLSRRGWDPYIYIYIYILYKYVFYYFIFIYIVYYLYLWDPVLRAAPAVVISRAFFLIFPM